MCVIWGSEILISSWMFKYWKANYNFLKISASKTFSYFFLFEKGMMNSSPKSFLKKNSCDEISGSLYQDQESVNINVYIYLIRIVCSNEFKLNKNSSISRFWNSGFDFTESLDFCIILRRTFSVKFSGGLAISIRKIRSCQKSCNICNYYSNLI